MFRHVATTIFRRRRSAYDFTYRGLDASQCVRVAANCACAEGNSRSCVKRGSVCMYAEGVGKRGGRLGAPECTRLIQFTGSAELRTKLLTGGGRIDVYPLGG